MKIKLLILIPVVFLIGLLVMQGCIKNSNNQFENMDETSLPVLTSTEMQKIIEDSVTWFKNAQLENGRFNYEYSPFKDSYSKEDNIVRQTGALYFLGETLRRDKENKYAADIKPMMQKSIGYFVEKSTDGKYNNKTFKCILKTSTKCSLGAVSLALIGVVDLVQKYPELEEQYSSLMTDYVNYITAMKMEGKGYMDAYYIKGDQSEKESTFSNGEAFLALVRYNQYKPSDAMKKMIDDSFVYFADVYSKNPDNNFYLWGMAAIKELYATDPKEEYFTFVKNYTDARIKPYKNKRKNNHNYAAYAEGITSAYSILKNNITEEEKQSYLEEINFWLSKTNLLQVKESSKFEIENKTKKASVQLEIKDSEKAIGGFLTGAKEDEHLQRIDFTQHAASAYLQKLVDIDGWKL